MLKDEDYLLSQHEYTVKALTKLDKAMDLINSASMLLMNIDGFRYHSKIIDSHADMIGYLIEEMEIKQADIEECIEQELTIANEMR